MDIKNKIGTFVENHLSGTEHFLVEVEQKGTERFPKLFVYIDGDKGVDIDTCSSVSREVNKYIEENNLITTEYGIDVSSPGVDKPLVLKRQYKANTGRKVRVWLLDDATIEGKLLSSSDDEIELEIKKGKNVSTERIEFSRIHNTKVLITF